MLFRINVCLGGVPATLINFLSLGPYGASLCARLYFRETQGTGNLLTKLSYKLINKIEANHCRAAYSHWWKRACHCKKTQQGFIAYRGKYALLPNPITETSDTSGG